MQSESLKIGVIGTGSWGKAIARLLLKNGSIVNLWCYETKTKEDFFPNLNNNN